MSESLMVSFANRLGLSLTKRKMSRKELAAKSGVSVQCLSDYFTEKKQPSVETLTMLARALNVSADYLLGLSDVQTPDAEVQAICKKTGLSMAAALELSYRHSHADDVEANFINQLVESDWFAKSVGATEADCEHT